MPPARTGDALLTPFLQHVPASLAMLDTEMRYVAVSEQYRQRYSPHDSLVGRVCYEVFPDLPERWRVAHRRALGGEVVRADVDRWPRADGTVHALRWVLRPWHAADGRIGGVMLLVEDLSEVEEVSRAVQQSEERLRQLADAMPQIVWVAEPDGRLEFLNRRWYETTGLLPDPAGGVHDWKAAVHPDDHAAIDEAWRRARHAGDAFECEYRLYDVRSSTWRWHLGRTTAERDDAGRVTRWYGTATDIHDRRLAEDAVREADRHKTDFLAMLSHELRNPLGPLQNAVAYLDRVAPPDEAQARARSVIGRQVAHMTRLVDDLLDVARIASGKIELRRRRLDFAELVVQAVEDARPAAVKAGLALDVTRSVGAVPVEGDATRLAQVVSNLLHNALKFTARGGRVTVSVHSRDHHAELRVADTGIGIAPEVLPKVFVPFFQAGTPGEAAGDEHAASGLGLGLALVRGLTEIHGGNVAVSSPGAGAGAEFVVRLPLTVAPSEAVPLPQASSRSQGRRVLVIEDNHDAAESLQLLLELDGHEVAVAHSGASGIEAAERISPEVVICDIGLPGGTDGYDVARALRASDRTRDAVMVALTGYGQEEHVQQTRLAGFDAHVVKPIDVDRLERVLADALARRPVASRADGADRASASLL